MPQLPYLSGAHSDLTAKKEKHEARLQHVGLILYVLTLLGAGLRFYRLDFQSLWLDEATSAFLASFPFSDIIKATFTSEPNPPLYFCLLRSWSLLLGNSEVALRSLSALAGVIYVPIVYLLGREILSRRIALLAAAISATSPFLIWFSQEARAFSLVALLTLVNTYFFVKACHQRRVFWWIGFSASLLLSLYLHFYAALLIPFELLFFLLFYRRYGQQLLSYLVATIVPVLFYLPWLASIYQAATGETWRSYFPPVQLIQSMLHVFISGELLGQKDILIWVIAFVLIAAAGLLPIRGRRGLSIEHGEGLAFLALYLLIPIGLISLLSIYTPVFMPRYIIIAAAPFYLLVARGLDRLWRISIILPIIGLSVILSVFGWSLSIAYGSIIKEDYRSAAEYMKEYADESDAIIFVAGSTKLGFEYYGVAGSTPFGLIENESQIEAELLNQAKTHSRLWLILSHEQFTDPKNLLLPWLSSRYPKITEQYPVGIQIHGFSTEYRLTHLPPTAEQLGDDFAGKIRLLGYEVTNPELRATDRRYHPPSNWLHVILYWEIQQPLEEDLGVMVRLIDNGYQVWGDRLYRSGEVMRFYPTSCWKMGEIIRDEYDVNLNPVTPAGTYRLEVSMMSNSTRLDAISKEGGRSDRLVFGEINVIQ